MAKSKSNNPGGSSQLTGHLLIYLLVLALGVGLGIVPMLQTKASIGNDIKRVQAELQRQEKLYPVYQDIMAQLSVKLIKTLPLPGDRQLNEEEIEDAKQQLRDEAEMQGLHVLDIHHDPHSLEDQGGQVLVNCKMSGDFMLFRNYLISLGSTDFVKHIQQVEMQESSDGVIINLKLRLSVATKG